MEDKTKSRKFIVWITFLFITIALIASAIVAMIISGALNDSLVELVEKVVEYFFFISLTYLGVNAGQKIGLAAFNKGVNNVTNSSDNDISYNCADSGDCDNGDNLEKAESEVK